MNGGSYRQSAVRSGVSVHLLESATHDALSNGVCETEFTRTAPSWLTVFWIGEDSATDTFDVTNLIIG